MEALLGHQFFMVTVDEYGYKGDLQGSTQGYDHCSGLVLVAVSVSEDFIC